MILKRHNLGVLIISTFSVPNIFMKIELHFVHKISTLKGVHFLVGTSDKKNTQVKKYGLPWMIGHLANWVRSSSKPFLNFEYQNKADPWNVSTPISWFFGKIILPPNSVPVGNPSQIAIFSWSFSLPVTASGVQRISEQIIRSAQNGPINPDLDHGNCLPIK